jgi:hypothetical protein
MNYWPPFWGAGIHIDRISSDHLEIDVSLKLCFWNRNYVGTQYGGSLYSMTDPFYMLMLIQLLGRDYIVWDKGATINFRKPGKEKVYAEFRLTKEQVAGFKAELKEKNKIEPVLKVLVKNTAGEVIAEVDKVLYIKKRKNI